MQKSIQLIVFFLLSLLSISANTQRVFKAADGFKAPEFTVTNDGNSVALSDYRGQYVIVNFWTSTDADSRIAAARYSDFAAANRKIHYMSVNLDRDAKLFSGMVKADNLNEATQFHPSDEEARRIIRDYALSGAMTTFLVDPTGSIIATNPSIDLLRSINV